LTCAPSNQRAPGKRWLLNTRANGVGDWMSKYCHIDSQNASSSSTDQRHSAS